MSLSETRAKREKFYRNESRVKSTFTEIYISMPNGPIGIKKDGCDGSFCVARNMKELAELCVQAVQAVCKREGNGLVVHEDEVTQSLMVDIKTKGLALHLLPYLTFSVISHIEPDSKGWKVEKSLSHMITGVIQQCKKDMLMFNIFTEKDMPSLMSHEALPDPLFQTEDPSNWNKYLQIAEDEKANDLRAGLYVISPASCERKIHLLLTELRQYGQVSLKGYDNWLEANALVRLSKAAKLFDYPYTIEKGNVPNSFFSLPKDFCHTLNKHLEAGRGRRSLSGVMMFLKEKYLPGESSNTSIEKLSRMLCCVSQRNEENTVIRADVPWIFAYNRDPKDHTHALPGIALDFKECNIAKYFWRNLHDFFIHYNSDLRDSRFAQQSIIGFPYQCGFRNPEKVNEMCPWRFRSMRDQTSHAHEFHGLSSNEMEIVREFTSKRGEETQVQNEYLWLENHDALNIFDRDRLRQRHDLGNMMADFMPIHFKNWQIITELQRLTTNYEECTNVYDCSEQERSKNRHMVVLCKEHLTFLRKGMLQAEDMVKYVHGWLSALKLQASVLTEMNDMNERIQNSQATAKRVANVFTDDLNRELQRAGNLNFGAVRPGSLVQSIPADSAAEGYSSTIALAVISSLTTHDEKAAEHNVNIYRKAMEDNGFETPSLKKRKAPDGMSRHTDMEIYKKIKSCDGEKPQCSLMDLMQTTPTLSTKSNNGCQLQVVQPISMQVSLADYPELSIYLLGALQRIKLMRQMFILAAAQLFANTANAMYLFTDSGYELVKNVFHLLLNEVYEQYHTDPLLLKRNCWFLFCKLIHYINKNASGRLRFLFKVRLARHGDTSMAPVKFIEPTSVMVYGEKSTDAHVMVRAIQNVPDRDLRMTVLDSNCIDSADFECKNIRLIQEVNKCYNVMTCTWKGEEKTDDSQVNNFRKTHCPICQEQFSNRPIEGFNCLYRDAERQFLEEQGLPPGTSMEDIKKSELYTHFISKRIQGASSNFSTEHSSGMHLFHKECIRRWIQLKAIDVSAEDIKCPSCRTTVYNRTEKDVILCNIHDVACRLLIGLSDNSTCLQTDEIINVKGQKAMWSADRILRDFGPLNETSCLSKCNANVNMEQLANEKDPTEYMDFLQRYIDATTPNCKEDIVNKNDSPLSIFDKFMARPQSLEKATLVSKITHHSQTRSQLYC